MGCAVALVVATVAPSAPLRKPGILAAQLLQEMAATLRAAAAALRAIDRGAADQVLERARAGEDQLKALQDAADEGLAVVRHSPFRHRQLGSARAYADLTEPLGRAHRNLRVLARRSLVAVWRGDRVPEGYLHLLESTAAQAERMAGDLHEGKLPVAARKQLVAVAVELLAPAGGGQHQRGRDPGPNPVDAGRPDGAHRAGLCRRAYARAGYGLTRSTVLEWSSDR